MSKGSLYRKLWPLSLVGLVIIDYIFKGSGMDVKIIITINILFIFTIILNLILSGRKE